MARQILDMTREELQAAAKTLIAVIGVVLAIDAAVVGYVIYSLSQGRSFSNGAALPIALGAGMVGILPAVMRLGAIKKRLRELGR